MSALYFTLEEIASSIAAATKELRVDHSSCDRMCCPWPTMTDDDVSELTMTTIARINSIPASTETSARP